MGESFKRERFTNAINVIKAFGMSDQKQAQARISIIVDKLYRACKDDEELFRHLAKEELTDYEANKRDLASKTEKNNKHIDEITKMLDATKP